MEIIELPRAAQEKLGTINLMAAWFGGYFVRQAERVVEEAINDNPRK